MPGFAGSAVSRHTPAEGDDESVHLIRWRRSCKIRKCRANGYDRESGCQEYLTNMRTPSAEPTTSLLPPEANSNLPILPTVALTGNEPIRAELYGLESPGPRPCSGGLGRRSAGPPRRGAIAQSSP